MNNGNLEKAKVVLLGVIATVLLCLLVVVSLKFKQDNKFKNDVQTNDNNSGVTDVVPDEDDTSLKEEDTPTKEENTPVVEDNSTSKNPDNSVSDSQPITGGNTNTNQGVTNNKEEVVYHESDVVSYFEELNQNIDTYKSSDNTTMKEKIKTGFITVVDFLFYDGVIKGHTFDELTGEAKIKVLTLALKIDNKIGEYFPNYKESIKDKTSALAFKEKVAVLYLEATAKLCESVGEDSCNLARENFKDMKESFGFTWEGIKKVASTSASKLSVLLKEWYQSIKN